VILTDEQIIEVVNSGDIVIQPFEIEQVEPATYDMRVGKYAVTTSSKHKVNIEEKGFFVIDPGDFAVVELLEEVKMGLQYTARFGLRSKYARKGLIATTGIQIDPGFQGRLVIGLTNLSPKPISLSYKDDLISVEFHKLERAVKQPYSGPYQKKSGIGPEEIEFVAENEGMALPEIINTLRSLSANVSELSRSFGTFQTNSREQLTSLKWIIGIAIALLALIVTIVGIYR
jgi:dCTP deaminase